jgi:virginiamycin B lyase
MLAGTALAVPMGVQEAGAASAAYTATPSSCANIATVGTVNTTVATGSFSVTGGATASASGCTVTVADATGAMMQLSVVNTPSGGNVTIPGPSIAEYSLIPSPATSPGALIEGPDGNMWASDISNNGLIKVTSSGVATAYHSFNSYYHPHQLAVGSDGNLWAANNVNSSVEVWNTSGTFLNSFGTLSLVPSSIALGPDGKIWATLTDNAGTGDAASFDLNGNSTRVVVPGSIDASPNPQAIISAPDGTMWFCDNGLAGGHQIVSVTTTFGFTVIQNNLAGQTCQDLAAQADGQAVWMTTGTTTIVRILATPPYTVTTFALTGLSQYVAAGADGAMYVDENATTGPAPGLIARIPTANPASFTETATLTTLSNGVGGIALGPDGRLWFTEISNNKLGALTP